MSHIEKDELYFDDEELEDIPNPTPADIFIPQKERLYEIRELFRKKDIPLFIKKLTGFIQEYENISQIIFEELYEFLKELLPQFHAKQILMYDIKNLGPFIDSIWDFAVKNNLEKEFGEKIYHWYEHYEKYDKAKPILKKLLEIAKEEGDRISEAHFSNNYAYQFLLQGEWIEGVELFKQAAEIYKEEGKDFNYNNSRANYWLCITEINNEEIFSDLEVEIVSIHKALHAEDDARSRKPYYLYAKLEERKDNIDMAISYIKRAIEISEKCNSAYAEDYRKYKEYLECKM